MLHLRMSVPASASDAVVAFLSGDERVTNLMAVRGASLRPAGDAVLCDVAREAASDVLERLMELGMGDGSVSIETVDAAPTRDARRAEEAAPGSPDDGVVWELVEDGAWSGVRGSWSFYAFLTLATTIAAVAVVLDSAILVIGAMVVGPEFAAVAAVAIGVVLRRPRLSLAALRLLASGFAVAIALTIVLALAARTAGWVDAATILADRPQTGFIWHPDRWSFVVALLAGTAGVLSLTAGRTSALVGVFISVTTVPAAGNLAVALALGVGSEIVGSAAQLGVNLAGMVLAGVVTLLVQRLAWQGVRASRWTTT